MTAVVARHARQRPPLRLLWHCAAATVTVWRQRRRNLAARARWEGTLTPAFDVRLVVLAVAEPLYAMPLYVPALPPGRKPGGRVLTLPCTEQTVPRALTAGRPPFGDAPMPRTLTAIGAKS